MKFIKNHPLTAVLYVKMAKVHFDGNCSFIPDFPSIS